MSFMEGIAIACGAYLSGAIASGASYRLVAPWYLATRFRRYKDPRSSVCPLEFAPAVCAAFRSVLGEGTGQEWSENHFYLARAAVQERMPQAAAEAMRQNDLMRLRENMLIPLLVWCLAGLLLAISRLAHHQTDSIAIAALTLALTYVIGGRVACRAVDNRAREVREVCLALIVGERIGMLAKATASSVPLG